jgi:hypothetical protein
LANPELLAKIPAILDAHAKWYRGQDGGSRANLSGANLSGANLSGADLSRANLSGADLYGANLSGADLSRANLYGANLSGADLYGANLSGADLSRADLYGANLSGADLYGANLSGADLYGANGLAEAKGLDPLPFGPVTLPDWTFRAYKLGRGPRGERVVITLEIPEDAQRVAPIVGRKCRASKAKVIALAGAEEATSWHKKTGRPVVTYRAGETVDADKYDPSPFIECSGGIHFFISRREAEQYEG